MCTCMHTCTCTHMDAHVLHTHMHACARALYTYYLYTYYTCTEHTCTCVLYMRFIYTCTYDAYAHTLCTAVKAESRRDIARFSGSWNRGPRLVSRTDSNEADGARVHVPLAETHETALQVPAAGRACREQSASQSSRSVPAQTPLGGGCLVCPGSVAGLQEGQWALRPREPVKRSQCAPHALCHQEHGVRRTAPLRSPGDRRLQGYINIID